MNLKSYFYFFGVDLLLLLQNAKSFIRNNAKYSEAKLIHQETMEKIIKHGLKKVFGSFVVIGDWNQEDALLLSKIQSDFNPLYLMDRNNKFQNYKRFSSFTKINRTIAETKVYPTSNVVMVVSSRIALKTLLTDFRQSIWWNHEAHFLITSNDYENGCTFARIFLEILWKFNVLSAIYFCINKEKQVLLYTFNPYDRVGTAFWQVSWFNQSADNYWTMLAHSIVEPLNLNGVTFNNLLLERTRNLNHFNIHIGTREVSIPFEPTWGKKEISNNANIIQIILGKINATYTFKKYSDFGAIRDTDQVGLLKDIIKGSLNVATNTFFLRDYWKLQAYPWEFKVLGFATPKKLGKSSLLHFIIRDWSGIVAVSLVTIIIMKCVFRHSISRTLLEFVRMLVMQSVTFYPTRTKVTKLCVIIVLLTITFAISLINLFLQITLSSHKTVATNVRQIDTLNELIESDLQLIGYEHHFEFLHKETILKKFKVGNEVDCIYELQNGDRKACIIDYATFKLINCSASVHFAKQCLTSRPAGFILSIDWPLSLKFNLLMSYIAESGIYNHLSVVDQGIKWKWPKEYRTENIKFEDFHYPFYFLFIGCTLGLCMFLLELFKCKIIY